MIPNPPYHYLSEGSPSLDLDSLASILHQADEKRQVAFDISRKIHMQLITAKRDLESPLAGSEDSLKESLSQVDSLLKEALMTPSGDPAPHPRQPRPGNLGNRVEECIRVRAFYHFLKTGTLISPSECGSGGIPVTDEEYLAGACMGLAQDLSRYGVGRATARDAASVKIARTLVQEILDYLLKFDFRNGYLRRKYDGTKYSLKNLETLLYELSVTGATSDALDSDEPIAKRPKLDSEESDGEPGSLLGNASQELEEIRQRMEHRDTLRETLIKKCRDGQKAAKQAIYALHRGDHTKAAKLLADCEACIRDDLRPIVEEEPPLRTSGSFTGVLEEYAEARLFYVWLLGTDPSNEGESAGLTAGMLLTPEAFEGAVTLEPEEYLGGLCDLTGEVGRCAVQRGTARDTEGVRRCLETNSSVLTAIQILGRLPGAIGKKMDQLRRSVEKLERMTYEMSLSEAAGGRPIATEATTDANADGGGNATN